MSTKTKTQASKAAAELADTLESAPETGVSEERESTATADAFERLTAKLRSIPPGCAQRLQRMEETMRGFGRRVFQARVPVLEVATAALRWNRGRLLAADIHCPLGVDVFGGGLTTVYSRNPETGRSEPSGLVVRQAIHGRQAVLTVPTTKGNIDVADVTISNVDFTFKICVGADGKPVIDITTLGNILAASQVTNVQESICVARGWEYKADH